MRQAIIRCILLFFVSFSIHAATSWQHIAQGIDYTTFSSNHYIGKIHAFKINLKYNILDLAFARDHQLSASTVKLLAEKNQAIIAINGGFFTPELNPIGLRIQAGKIKNKIHNTHWWGIFYIKNNQAKISSPKQYHSSRNTQFAIQGGPRLIINGDIPKLKGGRDERSAIGITQDGDIILLVSQHYPLSTEELASLMRATTASGGLNCYNALNLDGGNSSQLYAALNDFKLNIHGLSLITDAILVINKHI